MRIQFLKPRRDVASAEEVRALREGRGWTVEQLAEEVHADALEVSAWEAGTVRVPAEQALRIRWMADRDAWRAALDAARGEACAWVRAHAPNLYERMFRDPYGAWSVASAEVSAHVAGCAACKAARERARQIGGYPVPNTSQSLLARYKRWVDRLPRWARGPFWFAGFLAEFGGWLAGTALVLSVAAGDTGFMAHVAGLLFGLMSGFVAWIAASAVVSRVTPGPIGALPEGLAAGAGALLGWALLDASVGLGDPWAWAVAAVIGLVFGEVSFRGAKVGAAREAQRLVAGGTSGPSLPPPS
ncbi:MAG TPA: helix-turn-helix transcriptional regulator, partial [Longimicrobium sp.]|nr:helix-turn-helix transcriptional regulator [Longimicrobium sp.]